MFFFRRPRAALSAILQDEYLTTGVRTKEGGVSFYGPIYGHFMGCTVNGFKPYIEDRERKRSTVQPIKRP